MAPHPPRSQPGRVAWRRPALPHRHHHQTRQHCPRSANHLTSHWSPSLACLCQGPKPTPPHCQAFPLPPEVNKGQGLSLTIWPLDPRLVKRYTIGETASSGAAITTMVTPTHEELLRESQDPPAGWGAGCFVGRTSSTSAGRISRPALDSERVCFVTRCRR